MSRQTQLDAYNEMKASGLLGLRQLEVLRAVIFYGPGTAGEIFEGMKKDLNRNFRYDSNTHARLTELRRKGCISELDPRPCKITGRKCIVWQATGSLPSKPIYKPAQKKIEWGSLSSYMVEINVPYLYRKQIEEWVAER